MGDAEFGVHIFLHTVVVTVQVVWCDVHQYGNVGTEVIHIVQLEGTQLNDVVIMLLRGYLQGQAVADVAGEADVQACTLEVVKSPGIPNDAPLIMKLKEKGTPIISEIEFAGRYTDAKMVCITGSNGKTTTTSLIYPAVPCICL